MRLRFLFAFIFNFFAARRFRLLAQKQPSPVVRKQHFEVVFFPPAHIAYITQGKVFRHRFLWNDEKKYVPTEEVKLIFRKLRNSKL